MGVFAKKYKEGIQSIIIYIADSSLFKQYLKVEAKKSQSKKYPQLNYSKGYCDVYHESSYLFFLFLFVTS